MAPKTEMTAPCFVAVDSVAVMGRNIAVRFVAENNAIFRIEIDKAIVPLLVAALISQEATIPGSDKTIEAQFLTAEGVRKFSDSRGRVGFELILDSGLKLPVLLPPAAILALRQTLDALQLAGSSKPPDQKPQ